MFVHNAHINDFAGNTFSVCVIGLYSIIQYSLILHIIYPSPFQIKDIHVWTAKGLVGKFLCIKHELMILLYIYILGYRGRGLRWLVRQSKRWHWFCVTTVWTRWQAFNFHSAPFSWVLFPWVSYIDVLTLMDAFDVLCKWAQLTVKDNNKCAIHCFIVYQCFSCCKRYGHVDVKEIN